MYFLHLIIRKKFCHACIFFVHDGMCVTYTSRCRPMSNLASVSCLCPCMCAYMCMYVYFYMYVCTYVCVCKCQDHRASIAGSVIVGFGGWVYVMGSGLGSGSVLRGGVCVCVCVCVCVGVGPGFGSGAVCCGGVCVLGLDLVLVRGLCVAVGSVWWCLLGWGLRDGVGPVLGSVGSVCVCVCWCVGVGLVLVRGVSVQLGVRSMWWGEVWFGFGSALGWSLLLGGGGSGVGGEGGVGTAGGAVGVRGGGGLGWGGGLGGTGLVGMGGGGIEWVGGAGIACARVRGRSPWRFYYCWAPKSWRPNSEIRFGSWPGALSEIFRACRANFLGGQVQALRCTNGPAICAPGLWRSKIAKTRLWAFWVGVL